MLWEKSKIWVMQRSMEREGERSTVRQSPMATDDSHDGCHCNKCGGRSDEGLSWEHEFNTPLTEEIDAQGENWFKSENSLSERRTMMRLERELEAALWFEHEDDDYGGLRSNPIWITRILLGRLFRERQVLGKAVKLFARFQRREIMPCMVKINDLEERVEPPLYDTMGASTSASFKGDAMDVEESVGLQEGIRLATHLSPREAQGET